MSKLLAPFAAATVLAFAGSAHAAVYLATMEGTVAEGYDTSGTFGAVGVDLTNASFKVELTYDTNINNPTPLTDVTSLMGGTFFGPYAYSPITDVTVTINGFSYSYSPTLISTAYSQSTPGSIRYEGESETYSGGLRDYRYFTGGLASDLLPGYLDRAFSTVTTPSPIITGGFSLINGHNTQTGDIVGRASTAFVTSSLTVTYVSESPDYVPPPPAPVPEPSTWAMMIIGFGMVGAVTRRRRLSGCDIPFARG